jgi:cellulose 1,4-beta-cellobiosidase
VTPVNAGGTATSGITTTRPAAPATLSAIAGDTQVTLNWSVSIGATGYVLESGTSSGNATNIVVSGITTTNYVNTGLTNGLTYYYVVDAIGTAATSGNSPQVSAMPVAPPPPTITQFVVNGASFTLSASGGVPNSTNYILVSTNLASPLTNWTRLFTNQFDNSGNFNFTNSLVPGGPQLFYRLLMQP